MKRNKRFSESFDKSIAKKAAVLLACTLCVSNLLNAPIEVMAKSMPHKKEGEVYGKYIEAQKEKDTKILDKKVEKKLNDGGMFDHEIEMMNENEIKAVENAELISIVTKFYGIDEEGNAYEMSEEEIDTVIEQEFADEISEYADESIIESTLQSLGFIPQTVYASNSLSDYEVSPSGCLKKTLIITQNKPTSDAHVIAYFSWVTNPGYRLTDAAYVLIEGANIRDNSNANARYVYNRRVIEDTTYYTGRTTHSDKTERHEVSYTNEMKKTWKKNLGTVAGAGVSVNLKDNTSEYTTYSSNQCTDWCSYSLCTHKREVNKRKIFTNHLIVIELDLYKDSNNPDYKYFSVDSQYNHQKFAFNLEPSVSFNSDKTVSFGIAASLDKYMQPLGKVLTINFYWATKATTK